MIISDITPQKRTKERFNIYIDGEYALSLNAETIVSSGVKIDMEVSQEFIEALKQEDTHKYALQIALKYISYKARTEKEVRTRLAEFDEQSIDYAVDMLKGYGYINDREYVEEFVRQYTESGKYGPYAIRYKLIEKGIGGELLQEAMEDMRHNQRENAQTLIEKLMSKYSGKPPQKRRQSIYQALMSKGYEYDEVKDLLSEMDFEE